MPTKNQQQIMAENNQLNRCAFSWPKTIFFGKYFVLKKRFFLCLSVRRKNTKQIKKCEIQFFHSIDPFNGFQTNVL